MCSFEPRSSVAIREAECADELFDLLDQAHHAIALTMREALFELGTQLYHVDRLTIQPRTLRSISHADSTEREMVYDMPVWSLADTGYYVALRISGYGGGLITISDNDDQHGTFLSAEAFVKANSLTSREQCKTLLATIADYRLCVMAARGGDGIEG